MEKKELYNQIMESVSKEVKKALNEDSILDDVSPVPGEQGVDCAKRLMNGIRRAYPEAAKFNGMKKAMLSILNNEIEINGFIRELRDQLKRESWHEK